MNLEKRVNKIESDYGIGGAKKHVGVIVMPGQNAELLQKEKLKDLGGELEKKEYYMKEFWKKVGDDQSNKRKVSISFPVGIFAVR